MRSLHRGPALLLATLLLLGPRTLSAEESAQLRPDFAADSRLVVGVTQMVQHHPASLVDLLRSIDGDAPVLGLVAMESEVEAVHALLRENELSSDAIELLQLPLQTMWLRDFGPMVGEGPGGGTFFLDAYYEGTENNPDDDDVPQRLADHFGVPVRPTPLQMEGGMLLSNGEGLVMLSTRALLRHVQRGEELEDVQNLVSASIPARSVFLVRPLPGEPTGHLDVFLALVAPDLCVVAGFDPEVNPKAATRVEELASQLEGASTTAGPLRLARVPTPPPTKTAWFSYTNIVQLGDLVLVPTYSQVEDGWNQRAIDFYRELLPERDVRGVDATTLIEKHGALRCVTLTLPRSLEGR